MMQNKFTPATNRPRPSDAIKTDLFLMASIALIALFVALPGAYAIAMQARDNALNVRAQHAPV